MATGSKSSTSAGTWLIAIGIGVIVVLMLAMRGKKQASADPGGRVVQPAAPSVPAVAATPKLPPGFDPSKRAEREKLIDKLQSLGVFGDIRVANGVGKVVAGPAFSTADFKAKQDFCGVAFAWCLDTDPGCIGVRVLDRGTNNEIGFFRRDAGLTMK